MRHTRPYLHGAVRRSVTTGMALLALGATAQPLGAQTREAPSLETLLHAPAADVASSYRVLRQLIDLLSLAERGGTVQWGLRTVTRDNVEQVRLELEQELATLDTAITQRGYGAISGSYEPRATKECERIPSMWAQTIRAGAIKTVKISQEEFTLQLIQEISLEGESFTAEIPGIIVDSIITFADPMNSDFGFVGEATAGTIVMRPEVDAILAAWPTWLKAPNRKDLARCAVSLRSAPGNP